MTFRSAHELGRPGNFRNPPWDQRIARWLVRPLAQSSVRPNHLTTLSLTLGIGAGALFAQGENVAENLAAGLFMAAVFTDHTDGELTPS